METNKQGVPLDPFSSQQQPQSRLPPHQRAVQRPQPPQYPPPAALQQPQRAVQRPLWQPYPPPAALPPPQRPLRQPYLSLAALQPRAFQLPQPPSLPLPPPPPQGMAPIAARDMPWQPQQFDGVRPYLSTQQPQRWGHIPRGGANIPSSTNASDDGADTRRFKDPAVFHWPMAPKWSTSSDSFMMFDPSVGPSSSTPRFSASQGQTSACGPQVGATDPFSARGDNASLDPYASALLSADQVDPRSRSPAQAMRRPLTMKEVGDLARQLVPGDAGSAGSSASLVRLLEEGCSEKVRTTVFGAVMGALHFVMGSSEWHVVFVELLRAGRFDELQVIVDVACKGEGEDSLASVADFESGVTSLGDLFREVTLHTRLRQRLINCLLNEGSLFQRKKCPDLLCSIFTTLPYKDSSVVIRHALNIFSGVFSSKSQAMTMVECFAAARNLELQDFEETILSHTIELAMGKHSNYFLQKVLERGRDVLKAKITDRVVGNLVNLSLNQYGTHVVQACFLRTGSQCLPLLQRVLTEFLALPDEQLAQLVQAPHANFVVRKLLRAGKGDFPNETLALALRIQTLPVAGLEQMDVTVGRVMEVVREVLL